MVKINMFLSTKKIFGSDPDDGGMVIVDNERQWCGINNLFIISNSWVVYKAIWSSLGCCQCRSGSETIDPKRVI